MLKITTPNLIHNLVSLLKELVDCPCSSSSFTRVAAIRISRNNVDHVFTFWWYTRFLIFLI